MITTLGTLLYEHAKTILGFSVDVRQCLVVSKRVDVCHDIRHSIFMIRVPNKLEASRMESDCRHTKFREPGNTSCLSARFDTLNFTDT